MTETMQAFRCVSSSATDIGCVRSLNEDATLERPEIGLWAVADGMGGHEAGDVASRTIVEHLYQIEPPLDPAGFQRDVRWRVQEAHRSLRREAERRGNGKTIGSTVVALLVSGQHCVCLWAGDSRLYLLRDGELRQVNRDHSLVQDMVDAGQLDAAKAESHPHANVITRAVGAAEELALEKWQGTLCAGDRLMLCSDGLTRYVPEDEIADTLHQAKIEDAAAALVEAALAHETRDNVSVIAVECQALDPADEDLADTLPRSSGRPEAPKTAAPPTPPAQPAPGGDGDVLLDRILAGEADPDPAGSKDLSDDRPADTAAGEGAGPAEGGESKGWGGLLGRFISSNPERKD